MEERFGVGFAAEGEEGDVELGYEGDDVYCEADVGAPDAEDGAEGEFVEGVAIGGPG